MSPGCCHQDFICKQIMWILSLQKLESCVCIVLNLWTGDHWSTKLMLLSWLLFVVSIFVYFYYYFFQYKEQSTYQMMVRRYPVPPVKTVSRISNWPSHASRKKQKTPRSQKKASHHVPRKNVTAKSCVTKQYKYYSRSVKRTDTITTKMHLHISAGITELCYIGYSSRCRDHLFRVLKQFCSRV